jgi:hypothetical protein
VKQLETLQNEIELIEEKYQQKFESLEGLKQSIITKAFSGQLINEQQPTTA